MGDNQKNIIKYSEYISKIFGAETHTDWREWLGLVWELVSKCGVAKCRCELILHKLRQQRRKDYECGITKIPDVLGITKQKKANF